MFAVLFVGWSLYLLLVYPVLRMDQIRAEYQSDRTNCYRGAYASASAGNFPLSDCISWTKKQEGADLDRWALGDWKYYRQQWPMLVVSIVLVPALLYCFVWRIGSVLRWVRGGFVSPFQLGSALARISLVLVVGWFAFCTVGLPILATNELTNHYKASIASCYDSLFPGAGIGGDSAGGDSYGIGLVECLGDARDHLKLGLNSGFGGFATSGMSWDDRDWGSFSGFYRHLGWLIIPMIAIPPLVTYAVLGIVGVIILWVWRGFKGPRLARRAVILHRTHR